MDVLIHKIYGFLSKNNKYRIQSYVDDLSINHQAKLTYISDLVHKQVEYMKIKPNEHRQDFILSKIQDYLSRSMSMTMSITDTMNVHMVDIGGGNGNILSGLNDTYQLPQTNFMCVETKSEWVESYSFNHSNITYLFWENNHIPIPDHACDVVFCMVSLHHMIDDTILQTIKEINRIMKKGGLLIIKEHDANNEKSNHLIHWEHHLYHILDCAYQNKVIDIEHYTAHTIHNFKSKESWQHIIIQQHGFEWIERTNRFLDGPFTNNDQKNITRLYWDIYKCI